MVMWLPLAIMAASMIASKAGKGAAGERTNKNNFIQGENNRAALIHGTQQRGLIDLLNTQERGTMDRAKIGLDAPGQRSRQSVIGSLLQNLQPAQISGLPAGVSVPQMSGGLTPAALNPAARAGGGEMQRQALMALMNKSDVPAMPNYPQLGMLPAPTAQGYQSPGKLESILSAIGLISSGAGAFNQMRSSSAPQPGEYGGY